MCSTGPVFQILFFFMRISSIEFSKIICRTMNAINPLELIRIQKRFLYLSCYETDKFYPDFLHQPSKTLSISYFISNLEI